MARRPIEKFDTEVTLPEWQLEPDNEAYFGGPDDVQYVDENGNPIPGAVEDGPYPTQPDGVEPVETPPPAKLDQQWIDNVLGRDSPRNRPAPEPRQGAGGKAPQPASSGRAAPQPTAPAP